MISYLGPIFPEKNFFTNIFLAQNQTLMSSNDLFPGSNSPTSSGQPPEKKQKKLGYCANDPYPDLDSDHCSMTEEEYYDAVKASGVNLHIS